MKLALVLLGLAFASSNAWAQDYIEDDLVENDVDTVSATTTNTTTTTTADLVERDARDIRAPGRSFGSIVAGPSFSSGLKSDQAMTNVAAALHRNMAPNLTGKIFADASFGNGNDTSRFLTAGAGLDFYPALNRVARSNPYLTADLGYGNTRNDDEATRDGLAVGLGGGVRFGAERTKWQAGVQYRVLTNDNEGDTPSTLAVQGGVNF